MKRVGKVLTCVPGYMDSKQDFILLVSHEWEGVDRARIGISSGK